MQVSVSPTSTSQSLSACSRIDEATRHFEESLVLQSAADSDSDPEHGPTEAEESGIIRTPFSLERRLLPPMALGKGPQAAVAIGSWCRRIGPCGPGIEVASVSSFQAKHSTSEISAQSGRQGPQERKRNE